MFFYPLKEDMYPYLLAPLSGQLHYIYVVFGYIE